MRHRERIRVLLALSAAVGLVLLPGPVARGDSGDPVAGDPFPIFSDPKDDLDPAVAYNSVRHEFLVAWEWEGNIYGKTVSRHGNTGTATFIFVTTGINHHPDVAYNSCVDEYLVVWEDDSANTWGARLDGAGTSIPGGRFLIVGGTSPAVAFNNDPFSCDFLVVWEDYYWIFAPNPNAGPHKGVWGQRVAGVSGAGDGGGELIGVEFEVQDDNVDHFLYYEPDVAYNLGVDEFLVVYTYDPSRLIDASARDVLGQRVTSDGQLQGLQTTINNADGAQERPAVAANHLNASTPYLVSYDNYGADPLGDVGARRLAADGTGFLWLVIAGVVGRQELQSDVAGVDTGGYVVVWTQSPGITYGRQVDNMGIMGDPFCVSERCGSILALSTNEARDPAVADGSPLGLAVWENNLWPTGGLSWDIYGQLLGYRAHLPLVLRDS